MKIDSIFWMVLLPIVDLIGNYFFGLVLLVTPFLFSLLLDLSTG